MLAGTTGRSCDAWCGPRRQESGCVALHEDQRVEALTVGRVASFYYLKHQTMAGFTQGLQPDMGVADVRIASTASPLPACAS